ncbi:ABC transporter permease [Streptomyces zingiberis]|uniref:ABC transporter permease subunit n=1 Tax=Streptomyces zingiberis TaxID=2053010 RepID=A0ABX1C1P3_9ACTN|nr:ABC transporter permease subunit [Streptomyces zingiberis]NJQ03756.1 ABC transporter permease subunit [Streptomyces zingiberis]
MSTSTVDERSERENPGATGGTGRRGSGEPATTAPPPRQPDGKNENGSPPGPLARLLGNPRLSALLAAVLVAVTGALLVGDVGWPQGWTVDLEGPLNEIDDWLVDNRNSHWLFLYFLLHISNTATSAVDLMEGLFEALGWIGVTVVGTLVAWAAGGAGLGRRALRTAGTALGVFAVVGLLDMWDRTMQTLALMTVSVFAAAVLGLLLGLAAGLSDRCERLLRPVFDAMQVMPAFAYLIPFLLIFGIGIPSAAVATVIYAAPPMARLTSLGLRGADPVAMEASASLGASSWQRLRTARLPLARKEMMLGLNQTIMMCLSMVVLASLIGAGGLGEEIYQALGSIDVGAALAAGVAIVLLAVLLDRTTAAAGERLDAHAPADPSPLDRLRGGPLWAGIAVLTAVLAAVGGRIWDREWPGAWTIDIAEPVNTAVDWFLDHVGSGIPLLGGTLTWADGFTTHLLNPLRTALLATPWWAVLLLAVTLAWFVGRWRAALAGAVSLVLIGVMGLWGRSLDTLSQVLAGLALTLLLGFVLGVLTARVGRVERLLRPVLDTMQTMPQFVYLIPVIAAFGLGRAPGIAAAVIYALPAVVRITAQGLRSVDPVAMEAARSLGATGRQQLLQVQLPLARRALLVATNQGVVLVLSMVVIGGMVGGGALGIDVVTGLAKGDLGRGLPAGLAIVCLGILLDRVTQPMNRAAARGH